MSNKNLRGGKAPKSEVVRFNTFRMIIDKFNTNLSNLNNLIMMVYNVVNNLVEYLDSKSIISREELEEFVKSKKEAQEKEENNVEESEK